MKIYVVTSGQYSDYMIHGVTTKKEEEVVFCNPPYGRNIGAWVKKCAEADATVVMLIPARTDTSYFHDYIYGKAEVRFLRGRLKFELGGGSAKKCCTIPKHDRDF